MNTSYNAKLVVCPPIDPSGKIAATPFEVDFGEAYTALLTMPTFPLSGSGSTSLPLGAIPSAGARLFVLMLDTLGNPSPITVTTTYADSTTGGGKASAIGSSPGLFVAHDPDPTAGIVSVSVTHSSNAIIRYVAIG